ncbi:hypothetical protein Vadar_003170 [Vaccinium darrowii]|uniref:Uncharacterized protein n=1 Tax=Vaccinium darrowii TaxID=229202 RepID=A0ACB7ZH76_9ERIC|nr:hypothetical protein Vadar_003170 [Vaccinium darrowii]
MLALEGDYTSATIVICGGAQAGAFQAQAVDRPAQASCGRIVATDPDPGWEMEDMPFVRIMGDTVMLPTGDVLIINGAQAGSQGYGLATNPALNPVLYEPDEPVGNRFTTLTPTDIPRVYHSTANLLPDGRVLVAGSNTHYYYTYTGVFPSELRIEAFSPAYLAADVADLRPVVVDATGHVHYGEAFVIFVTVPAAVTRIIEVNFASAPFTTHSFSQGQRLIKLAVTDPVPLGGGEYRIGCTAPPNANVAPPGYYMLFEINQGVPSVAAWVHVI